MRTKIKWVKGITKTAQLLVPYLDTKGRQKSVVGLVKSWGGFNYVLAVIYKDKVDSYLGADEEDRLARLIMGEIEKGEPFLKGFKKLGYAVCDDLIATSKEIGEKNAPALSNKELARLYSLYCKKYAATYQTLVLGLWPLQQKIRDWLSQRVKNSVKEQKYLEILTTPSKQTLMEEEKKDLLKIAIKVAEDKKLRKLFKESLETIKKTLAKISPELEKQIKLHTQKYCWLASEGEAAWDKTYFLDLLSKMTQEAVVDFKSELRGLEEMPSKLEKERRKVLIKLSPPRPIIGFIDLVRFYAFLRLYRRLAWSQAQYYTLKLFEEIGQRLTLTLNQLRFLTPLETRKWLLDYGLKDCELLKKRMEYCVLLMKRKQIKIFVGDEAQKVKEREILEEIDSKKQVLKGTCASPGEAVGKVKIIQNIRQMNKMEKGDVLVAQNITPDLTLAMKKASAVLSEMGGLTCHAAIISRELGIPCIVGVEHAVEILKDNEIVKVDATSGTIQRG